MNWLDYPVTGVGKCRTCKREDVELRTAEGESEPGLCADLWACARACIAAQGWRDVGRSVPYAPQMEIKEGMTVLLPGGQTFQVLDVVKDDGGNPPVMRLELVPVDDENAPQSED